MPRDERSVAESMKWQLVAEIDACPLHDGP